MTRRLATILLPVLALLFAGAGGEPANRETPMLTLERFKRAFASNDSAGEWDTISPGFKRRMSQRMGRNLDVGDYRAVREKHYRDPRIAELRQWLPSAHMTDIKYDGRGFADVIIRFGAPLILGENFQVKMVNHGLWELKIRGEAQPYWGFNDDKSIQAFFDRQTEEWLVVTRDRAGKVVWQKRWPKAAGSYRTLTRWYFESFGAMEETFLRNFGQ